MKTTWSLGQNICSNKITTNKADQEQADLLEHILNLIIKPDQEIRMIKKIKECF